MKESVHYQSSAYQATDKDNYTLTILLGKHNLQYAIYNHYNQLLYFAALFLPIIKSADELIQYFLERTLLGLHFNHIIVGVVEEFAVIPKEYFDDSHLSAYLVNQLGKNYKAEYCYDTLENPKVRIVYKKDDRLNQLLQSKFKHYKMLNSITPIIQNTITTFPNSTLIINHFFENRFDYLYIKEGTLQMANRYNAKTASNYLYFLLNALKHNKIDLSSSKLYLAGIINEDKSKLIHQYKQPVEYIGFDKEDKYKAHQHFNLSTLARCA